MDKSLPVKIGICIGAAYLGLQAPMLFLKNAISKRQLSIKRAFPDALDLLLICIESGMSVEAAFRKVSTEIVTQSVALSEEFTLTTAELSYLQDRKVAYENLAKRTGLEGVKSVCLALHAGGALRHAARPEPARDGAGKPRHAHERGREEGRRAAAEADRADDPVLPAGACSSSFSDRPTSRSRRCSEPIAARTRAGLHASDRAERPAPRRARAFAIRRVASGASNVESEGAISRAG